jgi:hypothetical protein
MERITSIGAHCRAWFGLAVFGMTAMAFGSKAPLAADMPNACPVDGCTVEIIGVKRAGDEIQLTLKANYTPDMSKNHIHVWWGENFTVQQVSNNAEPVYKVKQGEWHPMADYPVYITQSAASTKVRGNAKTLCVSPADRNHDILDAKIFHCVDVSSAL